MVSVDVLEAPAVDEAVILRLHRLLTAGRDGVLHQVVDLGPAAARQRQQPLGGLRRSITNASSLTIMHAALSSVNFGLNVKPSAEKNSFDALRSRTATSNATLELGWSHCPHYGAATAEAARHAAHRKSTNTSDRRPRRVGRSGFPEAPDSKWWRAHVSSPDIQSLGEQRLDRRRAEQAKLPHLGLDSGHEELISELNQCPGVDDSAVVAP